MLTTATMLAIGGAGMNLIQAQQARDDQKAADRRAGELMADAKRKLEKDFYEGLKVPMEAYEQAYTANIQSQQQNIEALQQADSRSLAAGVGKVGMLSNMNAEQIRATQGRELFDLEKLKAENRDDMNQQMAQMDVAGAQDQAKRSAQADERMGMLQAGATTALAGAITGNAEAAPLNAKVGLSVEETLAKNALEKKTLEDLQKNKQKGKVDATGNALSLLSAGKFQGKPFNPLAPNNISLGMFDQKTNLNFMQPPPPQAQSAFTPDVNYGFSFQDRLRAFRKV
jgi:hypothetical protein|tara:strand:- start:9870 stop:10721 length:852 start_codon:yes stop_codon:yes gene_type:complete